MTRVPQRGFALVAALFVLIVLAMLGMFAMRTSTSNVDIVVLKQLENKAETATQFGVQWAAVAITNALSCAAANPSPDLAPGGALVGFNVTVSCQQATNHVPEGMTFDITVTATSGAFGTPSFVSRTVRTRIPR